MRTYPDIGLLIPKLLLPDKSIDFKKWAVVACDQFTSELNYWEKVEQLIGNSPSTYHLILPEAYLGTGKAESHQAIIERCMDSYIANKILRESAGLVYVERKTESGIRKGLMAALDLEKYEFAKNSTSLIRATEGTIVDRLPPRIQIRKKALLEVSHILVLIDDPDHTVIEPLSELIADSEPFYDFELMMGGGHVRGFRIHSQSVEERIVQTLIALKDPELQQKKYHFFKNTPPLLYAVGDGNHSLATAKSIWEDIRNTCSEDHPARYALVEIVNIHDPAVIFKPIHRIFKHGSGSNQYKVEDFFGEGCQFHQVSEFDMMKKAILGQIGLPQKIGLIENGQFFVIDIHNPPHTLPVGSCQLFLNHFLLNHTSEIDYIHGDSSLHELSAQPGHTGFYLPALDKSRLFESVIKDGPLPRKTFSMGEAHQKRYYLECRKIRNE